MIHQGLEFHGIDFVDEINDSGGWHLRRLPPEVHRHLNPGAKFQYLTPAGAEIRFVPTGKGSVKLTLSSLDAEPVQVSILWGGFAELESFTIETEPTVIKLTLPERFSAVTGEARASMSFCPRVCRVVLPTFGKVAFHKAEGDFRLPLQEEKPQRRAIFYGTSITHGASATRPYLAWASLLSRWLGMDCLNYGTAGSCHIEPEMSDFIAGRSDWDLAVFCISVNLVGDFKPAHLFAERTRYLLGTCLAAHPKKPIVAFSPLPWWPDFCPGSEDYKALCDQYRTVLQSIGEELTSPNLHIFHGPDLLRDVTGLTTDLLHPSDLGMIEIAKRLEEKLRLLV
ncbi:MAG: SGNH/GDSL hydrolase family protein [Sumerlaeia bacterium]